MDEILNKRSNIEQYKLLHGRIMALTQVCNWPVYPIVQNRPVEAYYALPTNNGIYIVCVDVFSGEFTFNDDILPVVLTYTDTLFELGNVDAHTYSSGRKPGHSTPTVFFRAQRVSPLSWSVLLDNTREGNIIAAGRSVPYGIFWGADGLQIRCHECRDPQIDVRFG